MKTNPPHEQWLSRLDVSVEWKKKKEKKNTLCTQAREGGGGQLWCGGCWQHQCWCCPVHTIVLIAIVIILLLLIAIITVVGTVVNVGIALLLAWAPSLLFPLLSLCHSHLAPAMHPTSSGSWCWAQVLRLVLPLVVAAI